MDVILNTLSFLEHLKTSDKSENPLLNNALITSINITEKGGKSWYSNIKFLKEELKINESSIGNKTDLKKMVKKYFEQKWREEREKIKDNEGKLACYKGIKTKFGFEDYLLDIKNFQNRAALSRLRISNNCLEIERGRYKRPPVPRDERFCKFCDSGNNIKPIGDEKHFLLECPQFNLKRNKLYQNSIFNKNILNLSQENLFFYLLNARGKIINSVAEFVSDAFEEKRKDM